MSGPQSLQFDRAESPSAAAPAACSVCTLALSGSYFTLAGQVACERCKSESELAQLKRVGASGYLRATLLGSLAGAAGAAVWYAVRATTDYELGLIAIAVGYAVGAAVKKASGGRGGPLFQALAIALTYVWISANYIPDIAASLAAPPAAEEVPLSGAAFGFVVVMSALALPFLMGFDNAIGLLIIGFALYEAWKINKRVAIAIAGPFALGSAPAPGAGV